MIQILHSDSDCNVILKDTLNTAPQSTLYMLQSLHNSSSCTDKFVNSNDQLETNVREEIDRLIMITAVFCL